jgi:hypothetical protein
LNGYSNCSFLFFFCDGVDFDSLLVVCYIFKCQPRAASAGAAFTQQQNIQVLFIFLWSLFLELHYMFADLMYTKFRNMYTIGSITCLMGISATDLLARLHHEANAQSLEDLSEAFCCAFGHTRDHGISKLPNSADV